MTKEEFFKKWGFQGSPEYGCRALFDCTAQLQEDLDEYVASLPFPRLKPLEWTSEADWGDAMLHEVQCPVTSIEYRLIKSQDGGWYARFSRHGSPHLEKIDGTGDYNWAIQAIEDHRNSKLEFVR